MNKDTEQYRPRYDGLFEYALHGGPYNGKVITRTDLQQSVELPFYDPYEVTGSSYAIYGTRDVYQWKDRRLTYYSRKPCPFGHKIKPEFSDS